MTEFVGLLSPSNNPTAADDDDNYGSNNSVDDSHDNIKFISQ